MTLSAGEQQALLEWEEAGIALQAAVGQYRSKQREIRGAIVYDLAGLDYTELKAAFQADIVALKSVIDSAATDLTTKQAALP